jgi:hypothetical protein
VRVLLILPLLIVGSLPALSDYDPTHIEWKEWKVSSSEDLSEGRIHTSYPLTYLFDGDPRTAWVYSGVGMPRFGWEVQYALRLEPTEPVEIDSVWLMNGYNKSPETFSQNNRIVKIRLTVNGKVVKSASLSDEVGWHAVSVPRQKVKSLLIEFTGIRKGPENDVCVSELALYNRGREIDMHMPNTVMFSTGSECGCGSCWYLVSRSGRIVVGNMEDWGFACGWSPDGRYVAAAAFTDDGRCIWAADAARAKVIYRKALPEGDVWGVRWKDGRTVEVTLQAKDEEYRRSFTVR